MDVKFVESKILWDGSVELACSDGQIRPINSMNNEVGQVKILIIRNGTYSVAFVTLDCLYIGTNLKSTINGCFHKYGLPVFVTATHTHSMPNVSQEYSFFGRVSQSYLDAIINLINESLETLHNNIKFETILSISSVDYQFPNSQYRRLKLSQPVLDVRRVLNRMTGRWKRLVRLGFGSIVMAPNKEIIVPISLKTIELKSKNKTLVITSNFTHPTNIRTGFSSKDIYSFIEKIHSAKGFTSINFQGFAADVKLNSVKINKNIKSKIRSLFFGPSFNRLDKNELSNCVYSTLSSKGLNESLQHLSKFSDEKNIVIENVSQFIGTYNNGNEILYKFALVKIDCLMILLCNAEVSHLFLEEFSSYTPLNTLLIPISCEGECVGYLPHPQQVGYRGYEDHKFIEYFGFSGEVKRHLVEKLMENVKLKLKSI